MLLAIAAPWVVIGPLRGHLQDRGWTIGEIIITGIAFQIILVVIVFV